MEERGHEHGHRGHSTGFHWLDISLALSAFFVSLVSLWLAIHNGRTMEKLVAANSYPNVDFAYGNTFDFQDGQGLRAAVYLSLENTGIGPARLRAVELSFAGRPAANLRALLAICCTQEPAASLPKTGYWSSGDVRGAMVEAGKDQNLFAWAQAAADPRWPHLEQEAVPGTEQGER
jgi:hypothetical protein